MVKENQELELTLNLPNDFPSGLDATMSGLIGYKTSAGVEGSWDGVDGVIFDPVDEYVKYLIPKDILTEDTWTFAGVVELPSGALIYGESVVIEVRDKYYVSEE